MTTIYGYLEPTSRLHASTFLRENTLGLSRELFPTQPKPFVVFVDNDDYACVTRSCASVAYLESGLPNTRHKYYTPGRSFFINQAFVKAVATYRPKSKKLVILWTALLCGFRHALKIPERDLLPVDAVLELIRCGIVSSGSYAYLIEASLNFSWTDAERHRNIDALCAASMTVRTIVSTMDVREGVNLTEALKMLHVTQEAFYQIELNKLGVHRA